MVARRLTVPCRFARRCRGTSSVPARAAVFRIGRQAHQRSSGPARHLPPHFGQVALGHREVRVDGIEPLDQQQSRGVGLHHVSDIHQARARHGRRWESECSNIRGSAWRFRRPPRPPAPVPGPRRRCSSWCRSPAAKPPGLDDARVHLNPVARSSAALALRQLCLRRVQLRLIGARIDDKQQLILLQVRAVLEMPLRDAPGYLRRHVHRLEGAVLADLVQIYGHILRDSPVSRLPAKEAAATDRPVLLACCIRTWPAQPWPVKWRSQLGALDWAVNSQFSPICIAWDAESSGWDASCYCQSAAADSSSRVTRARVRMCFRRPRGAHDSGPKPRSEQQVYLMLRTQFG